MQQGKQRKRRKSLRPRDAQRGKLYDAERAVRHQVRTLASIEEAQDYVNNITRSRYYRARWPSACPIKVAPTRIDSAHSFATEAEREIRLFAGGHMIRYFYYKKHPNGWEETKWIRETIQDPVKADARFAALKAKSPRVYRRYLPPWGLNEYVILHEIAHIICYYHRRQDVSLSIARKRAGWHGWYFGQVFLDLVRRFVGKDAYLALRASFVKHKVRFRKPKVLKPETKAKLRERFREMEKLGILRRGRRRKVPCCAEWDTGSGMHSEECPKNESREYQEVDS